MAEIIVGVIGALMGGGGIAALARARAQNRALDASTLAKVTDAAQRVYERIVRDLRKEVDRLIEREQQCRTEVDELYRIVGDLRGRLERLEP